MSHSSSDRCKYEWKKGEHANCCYRKCWRDYDACIWHAEVDADVDKPVRELRESRETVKNREYNSGGRYGKGTSRRNLYFNWLKSRPAELLDGARLTDEKFREIFHFQHCWLRDADFSGTKILANFSIGRLDNSYFMDSILDQCQFVQCSLQNANLSNSKLNNTDFSGSDMKGSELSQADLTGSKIGGCDLIDARLIACNFENVDLSGSDLSRASLNSTIMKDTNLSGCILNGADMNSINMTRTALNGASLIDILWSNARLWNVAIDHQTEFGSQSIYEKWGDPLNPIQPNFTGIKPTPRSSKENIPVSSVKKTLDPEDTMLALKTAVNTASNVKTRLSQENLGFFRELFLYIHNELARFQKHRKLSDKNVTIFPDHRNHSKTDRKLVIDFLEKSIEIYRTQQQLYRENSLSHEVAHPYVREKDCRRKLAFVRGDNIDWIRLSLLRWSMLYGESPWRVISASISVILSFAALYHLFDDIPLIISFHLSAANFSTLGISTDVPLTSISQILASVQAFVGGVMIALLVVVLARRIMR